MKFRIFVAVVLIIAAAFVGRMMTRRNSLGGASGREETRNTYVLDAGATVEVSGINGSVEINTAETDRAEISITRTADSAEDLENRRIIIEHTSSHLVVRGESNARGWWRRLWGGSGNVRQQLVMLVPRRIELETKGVNGPVKIGEVDGGVSVIGVNGRVDVAQAAGHSRMTGINGNVSFAVSRLGQDGMDVNGVNGNVEIRLKETVDADVTVKGLNGNFTLDVPNVTMQERENRSNIRARLGAGGSEINVTGVNGNVRLNSTNAAAQPASPVAPVGPAAPVTPIAPVAPHAPPAPPAEDHD